MIEMSDTGDLVVRPGTDTDTDLLLDVILESGYDKDHCVAFTFSPALVAQLMYSGFLVMSANVLFTEEEADKAAAAGEELPGGYLLLPRHHLVRNVLFFDDLHISKTAARLIKKEGRNFELRVDDCYDEVVERCVAKHGADWLTPPRPCWTRFVRYAPMLPPVSPCSFALSHNGEL
jgi:hypothetical protein